MAVEGRLADWLRSAGIICRSITAARRRSENERLRDYAAHHLGCPAQPGFQAAAPCTCGLADILKEVER